MLWFFLQTWPFMPCFSIELHNSSFLLCSLLPWLALTDSAPHLSHFSSFFPFSLLSLYPKKMIRRLSIIFFTFPGELFCWFKAMLPIQVVLALGRMVWNRKPIIISIFIVAPMMPLQQVWIKEKTTTCLMTGTGDNFEPVWRVQKLGNGPQEGPEDREEAWGRLGAQTWRKWATWVSRRESCLSFSVLSCPWRRQASQGQGSLQQ